MVDYTFARWGKLNSYHLHFVKVCNMIWWRLCVVKLCWIVQICANHFTVSWYRKAIWSSVCDIWIVIGCTQDSASVQLHASRRNPDHACLKVVSQLVLLIEPYWNELEKYVNYKKLLMWITTMMIVKYDISKCHPPCFDINTFPPGIVISQYL